MSGKQMCYEMSWISLQMLTGPLSYLLHRMIILLRRSHQLCFSGMGSQSRGLVDIRLLRPVLYEWSWQQTVNWCVFVTSHAVRRRFFFVFLTQLTHTLFKANVLDFPRRFNILLNQFHFRTFLLYFSNPILFELGLIVSQEKQLNGKLSKDEGEHIIKCS